MAGWEPPTKRDWVLQGPSDLSKCLISLALSVHLKSEKAASNDLWYFMPNYRASWCV